MVHSDVTTLMMVQSDVTTLVMVQSDVTKLAMVHNDVTTLVMVHSDVTTLMMVHSDVTSHTVLNLRKHIVYRRSRHHLPPFALIYGGSTWTSIRTPADYANVNPLLTPTAIAKYKNIEETPVVFPVSILIAMRCCRPGQLLDGERVCGVVLGAGGRGLPVVRGLRGVRRLLRGPHVQAALPGRPGVGRRPEDVRVSLTHLHVVFRSAPSTAGRKATAGSRH